MDEPSTPVPITIITGFLGSGKTTLILNLVPQLPTGYRIALLKNEFGDVAVDSQLASSAAISGVKELLNGCICCNLVGSLQDALATLRTAEQPPDRIVVETSGSAFPATLAMEVNRIARETGHYLLDGVICVIDVENWKGYEDTSVTAKLQAQYTDLLILNKWELVSERQIDDCIDRVLDLELEIPTPRAKSDKGWVDKDLILGLDAKLASITKHGEHYQYKPDPHHQHEHEHEHEHGHGHDHDQDHHGEVEVLSIILDSQKSPEGIDVEKLEDFLASAPKDEVYRIKAVLYCLEAPVSSTGEKPEAPTSEDTPGRYILNWAFGRWTFTAVPLKGELMEKEPLLRMTVVTARYESDKWKKRIEAGDRVAAHRFPEAAELQVRKAI